MTVAFDISVRLLKHSTNDWLFSDVTLWIVKLAGLVNGTSTELTWGKFSPALSNLPGPSQRHYLPSIHHGFGGDTLMTHAQHSPLTRLTPFTTIWTVSTLAYSSRWRRSRTDSSPSLTFSWAGKKMAPSAPLCTVRPATQISICAFTPTTPQPTNKLLWGHWCAEQRPSLHQV